MAKHTIEVDTDIQLSSIVEAIEATGVNYLARVWLDVHWVPRVGEAIGLERLDAGDGAAMVECVVWEESNLATVGLVRLDEIGNSQDADV